MYIGRQLHGGPSKAYSDTDLSPYVKLLNVYEYPGNSSFKNIKNLHQSYYGKKLFEWTDKIVDRYVIFYVGLWY